MSRGASTGAEIQQQIIADTVGLYIKHTTIYDDLKRLTAKGLIELDGYEGLAKYYTLTEHGQAELERGVKLLKILLSNWLAKPSSY